MAGHKAVEIAHSDRRYQTAPRWYPAVVSALLLCSCLRSANAAGASVAQFSAISAQCGTAGVQVRQKKRRQHPTAPMPRPTLLRYYVWR